MSFNNALVVDFDMLLNFKDVTITDVLIQELVIHIYCESPFAEVYCPTTLQKCSDVNMTYTREIQDLPISGKRVYLHVKVRQFYSHHAGCYFSERFSFVEPHQKQTIRYQKHIYDSCKDSGLRRVVIQEDLCWKTVNSIYERYAEKALKHRDLAPPRTLGIDEFAHKKGHNDYAAVLVDLEQGHVIDVLPYRDKDRLTTYFKDKGNAWCNAVEFFSCDMWDGYVSTAKEMFPNADIVIDRFHFFAHMNKAVDNIRKHLRRQHPGNEQLKGVKWLLLKNPDNLSEKEKNTLHELLTSFPDLKRAYDLKNELRDIFETDISREEAENQIDLWVEQAEKMNNRYTNKFLKTLQNWKDYVLNYFIERISNGIVEGINNKIKMIKRMAFGFRNFEHMRLRIITNFD